VRARLTETVCHAPHLIDAEVGAVLRRQVTTGAVGSDTALAALADLTGIVDARYSHGPLSALAWSLRDNVTFYDALYVALAATLRVPLLTANARLAAAPGLPCAVEVLNSPSAPASG